MIIVSDRKEESRRKKKETGQVRSQSFLLTGRIKRAIYLFPSATAFLIAFPFRDSIRLHQHGIAPWAFERYREAFLFVRRTCDFSFLQNFNLLVIFFPGFAAISRSIASKLFYSFQRLSRLLSISKLFIQPLFYTLLNSIIVDYTLSHGRRETYTVRD